MLSFLYTSALQECPISKDTLSSLDLTKHHWFTLSSLWSSYLQFTTLNPTLQFTQSSTGFQIQESFLNQPLHFSLQRDYITLQRHTFTDTYGVLGLSLINPHSTKVILTEGVSDYFTAKLLNPSSNVLAFTTLGGNSTARKIVLSIFDSFQICQDNDSTGRSNATNLSSFLKSYQKSVTIFTPPAPAKDISEAFINSLKFALWS